MIKKKKYLTFSNSSHSRNSIRLSLPESSKYSNYSEECRLVLDNYFKKNYKSFGDLHVENYLRKTVDIKILNHYALHQRLKNEHPDTENFSTRDNLIDRIIDENLPAKRSLLKYLLGGFIFLLAYVTRSIISSLSSREDLDPPDILYIRKKDYPDLGIGEILSSNIRKASFGTCLVGFSMKKSKYKFNRIVDYKNPKLRLFKAFLKVLSELRHLSMICSNNDIPFNIFFRLIADSFLMVSIIKINSKALIGVLLDKPYYILLEKYKKQHQTINTMNESFFYPPFRTFDYSHADVYYSMNNIDEDMQNHFGGHISKFKRVSFFRKNLIVNSKGLSDECSLKIKEHSKTILATTVQISEETFIQFGVEELNLFLKAIYKSALDFPENLIILKGKKNELSMANQEMIDKILNQRNIFLIDSIKPRLLEYDHFEDLISVSDLMVSMNHASTTIWQSYAHMKPVIVINDSHPASFLSEYKNVEIVSNQLSRTIKYWLEMDRSTCSDFIKNISNDVNLGDGKGLEFIANDLEDQIDFSTL